MAYEHQKEVTQAVASVMKLIGIFTDDVPDAAQALDVAAASTQLFATITGVMNAEVKKSFKLKFFLKLGVALIQKAVDLMLPDEA